MVKTYWIQARGNWIPLLCVDRIQATGGVIVDRYWLWRGRKWLLVRRTEHGTG